MIRPSCLASLSSHYFQSCVSNKERREYIHSTIRESYGLRVILSFDISFIVVRPNAVVLVVLRYAQLSGEVKIKMFWLGTGVMAQQ